MAVTQRTNIPGYEKVLPSKKRPDRSAKGGGDTSVPRSRKKLWRALLLVFSIVLIVVIILVTTGIYFLIKDRTSAGEEADAADYRTIASLCRDEHDQGSWAKCIFEANRTGQCEVSVCQLVVWMLNVDESGAFSFKSNITNVNLSNSEKAHCGERKWCREKRCENQKLKPWANPIKFKKGQWIPDPQSACFDFRTLSDAKTFDAWREIRTLEECPNDMCNGNDVARISFRVEFQRCELEGEDETSYRHLPCDGPPLKIYNCSNCDGFSDKFESTEHQNFSQSCAGQKVVGPNGKWQGQCLWQCDGTSTYLVRRNGVPCEMADGKGRGYCLKGTCYKLSTT